MSKEGSGPAASSARSRLAARRAIWAAARKSSEAGTETVLPPAASSATRQLDPQKRVALQARLEERRRSREAGTETVSPPAASALATQGREVPAPRSYTSKARNPAEVVRHSADIAEEAAKQAQKAKEDARAAQERANASAAHLMDAGKEMIKAKARAKKAEAEQRRLAAEEERASSWSGTVGQAGRDLLTGGRPVTLATRTKRVQAAAESVTQAEAALRSASEQFAQAQSNKANAKRLAAEAAGKIQTAQDTATVAAVGARAVTSARLQLVVRDEVSRIIRERSDSANDDQLAQAIASRVVTLSRLPRLGGSAVSAATRGAVPAVHAAESDSQLAARRAAAIVGAFQALAPDSTGLLSEKVAIAIIKATMPETWRSKITNSPERRLLPFATKVAEAGAVVATLTGAFVLAGGALSFAWLAPFLFLPQVATRLGSAVRNLVRGVPDRKRRQVIADLLVSTLRASKDIEDTQLVGQMAAALVASAQSTNPGLNKAWLKEIAIDAAPVQHRAAVEAAVKTVAPGRLATGINYWLGTNFGGKLIRIR